jgi:hypothetical protein
MPYAMPSEEFVGAFFAVDLLSLLFLLLAEMSAMCSSAQGRHQPDATWGCCGGLWVTGGVEGHGQIQEMEVLSLAIAKLPLNCLCSRPTQPHVAAVG